MQQVVHNFAREHERQMANKVGGCRMIVPTCQRKETMQQHGAFSHAGAVRRGMRACMPQVVEQRRKLPPLVNDRSLFTRAAPFNDKVRINLGSALAVLSLPFPFKIAVIV